MTKIFVLVSLAALLGGCVSQTQEPAYHMAGHFVGNIYESPRGNFSVPMPVSREVEGRVVFDDAESVLFRDSWGSRIAFSSGKIFANSPMMTILQTQGRDKALEAYLTHRYGAMMTFHYHADILDGVTSAIYVKPVGPKTGVAAFIHGNRIFLVETDLVPGVGVLAGNDEASQDAHDVWLENRAVELLGTMQVR
jgi:hypothetical protein